MTCHNCRYADVPLDINGKYIMNIFKMYRCSAPIPNFLTDLRLPISLKVSFTQKSITAFDGKDCPMWDPRPEIAKEEPLSVSEDIRDAGHSHMTPCDPYASIKYGPGPVS